jgi:hypothetical protein
MAYAVNPALIDPMHGSGMEPESESDEEKEDMEPMEGMGRHRIHLLAPHLKQLKDGKSIVLKEEMMGKGKHHIHMHHHHHKKMLHKHGLKKGHKVSLKDVKIEGPDGVYMSSPYKEAEHFAMMQGEGKHHVVLKDSAKERVEDLSSSGKTLKIFRKNAAGDAKHIGVIAGAGKGHGDYGSGGSQRKITPAPSHFIQKGSPYARIESAQMSPFIPKINQNAMYNPL